MRWTCILKKSHESLKLMGEDGGIVDGPGGKHRGGAMILHPFLVS